MICFCCTDIYICYPDLHLEYEFGAALKDDCPCSGLMDDSNCSSLPECTFNMTKNGLCRANDKLPDGNENYSVQNCQEGTGINGSINVFRYTGGKREFIHDKMHNINFINQLCVIHMYGFLSSYSIRKSIIS